MAYNYVILDKDGALRNVRRGDDGSYAINTKQATYDATQELLSSYLGQKDAYGRTNELRVIDNGLASAERPSQQTGYQSFSTADDLNKFLSDYKSGLTKLTPTTQPAINPRISPTPTPTASTQAAQIYRDTMNNFFSVDAAGNRTPINLDQFKSLGINETFVKAGQTVPLSQAQTGKAVQTIPGVGTLTTLPKTPPQPTVQNQDPNLAGLYSRTGVTPPPNLTVGTPPQTSNGNNQYYKVGNDVFRLSDNAPVKQGSPDPTLDWSRLGLNIAHLNTKEQIQAYNQSKAGGEVAGASDFPKYPGVGSTTPQSDISTAYKNLETELDKITANILASKKATPEELQLAKDLQAKKAELTKFDTDTMMRAEAYSGRGRGETLNMVSLNQTQDARTRSLQRLGMAQDVENLLTQLGLSQEQRKQTGDVANTEYNLAIKKLDLALGVADGINKLDREGRDDARQYLLDVIDFANGKTYEQMDLQTQQAIMDAVANSPITLGMVKSALENSKEGLTYSIQDVGGRTVRFAFDNNNNLVSKIDLGPATKPTTTTSSENQAATLGEYRTTLEATKATNGGTYVDGNEYLRLRSLFVQKYGDIKQFDDTFRDLLSPSDKTKYGLATVSRGL